MNRGKWLLNLIGFALILSFTGGCGAPATTAAPTATITPAPPTSISSTATSTVTVEPTLPPPDHRIGVRVIGGIGEFYDRVSGEKFIPRGNNYIRLAEQKSLGGDSIIYFSSFNAGLYDPARAEVALQTMHTVGYNTVRVFLNPCCRENSLGDPAGGLSKAYMANVADFLAKAKANGMYVLITTDYEPVVGGYIEIQDTTWSENFNGTNTTYLRTGGIQAGIQFWHDFIQALVDQGAAIDAIFAYELRSEFFFESNLPPLSLTSGIVETANGKKYDMSSQEDRQRMLDEGTVYYIDALRDAILKVDPTSLVTVGFYWPQSSPPSGAWETRVIDPRPAIVESSADFVDLHPYPGGDLTLADFVELFKMAGIEEKPILMGEFGLFRSSYSTEAAAAGALHDWQVESCQYGFDGWLLWSWDTTEQTYAFNALDGGGEINQALAPLNRPDPCQSGAFDISEYTLAPGVTAVASNSIPDQPPSGAIDGTTGKWWGSGGPPTQWIQIDLGKPVTVGSIRLYVTQYPDGDTLHQIWVGSDPDQLYLLHTFEGTTVDGQVLEFKPEKPVDNVRYVRVVTRKSPSWVGWKEIEVLAP